jgi:peptide/nickel transport system permease protein
MASAAGSAIAGAGTPVRRARIGVRARLRRHPMLVVVLYRLAMVIPLLVIVTGLSFVLLSLTPGDAARQILGVNGTQAQYLALRHSLGLDLPLYTQYWDWVKHAITGDLGTSILSGQSVASAIGSRIQVTLSLVLCSLIVSLVIGVGLGVLSAARGGLLGRLIDTASLALWSLPVFWVAGELVIIFAVHLRVLPAVGYVPINQSVSGWLQSLVLPVAALSLGPIAVLAKQTREAMLDVLGNEYIRMAAANGIGGRSLIFRHALKNAALPIITVLGVQAVVLLGGAVFVESVFSLPGLGSMVVTSSLGHDIPVVLGVAVIFTIFVIIVNLVIDLAYHWLNPRLRAG